MNAESFDAAWDRREAAYLSQVEAVCAGLEDWCARLRAGAGETIRLAEHHSDCARFLTVEAVASGERGRRRRQELAARLAAMVDTARAHLEDPAGPPAATADWIVSIFFDRVYRYLSTAGGPTLASQLPELLFLAVSAYFGTEEGLNELEVMP